MRKGIRSRDDELITVESPQSVAAEAYRALRTNIDFLSPDNPVRSLLITSSGTKEGKTTTISNLGAVFARAGKKVILIDGDMRKPMVHRFFNLPNYQGLSNFLTEDVKMEEILNDSGIENLKIITSGLIPPNPAELLGSQRMRKTIEDLKEDYDLILIDVPPVIAVADAVILGGFVDGVLLVVSSHQTHREMLSKAKENLSKGNVRILGAVLNKYPLSSDRGYYYTYYEY